MIAGLFARDDVTGPKDVEDAILPLRKGRGRGTEGRPAGTVLRWLRENGAYLAPKGAGDVLLGGSVFLRNWLAIQFVVGVLVLGAFLTLQWARPLALDAVTLWSDAWPARWSPWLAVAGVPAAQGAMWFGIAYWLLRPYVRRSSVRKLLGGVGMVLVLAALAVLPLLLATGAPWDSGWEGWPQAGSLEWFSAVFGLSSVSGALVVLVGAAYGWWPRARDKRRAGRTSARLTDAEAAHWASRCLKGWLLLFAGTLGLAAADTLGGLVWCSWKWGDARWELAAVAVGLLTLVGVAGRRLGMGLLAGGSRAAARAGTRAAATGVAGGLLALYLVGFNAASHGVAIALDDGWGTGLCCVVLLIAAITLGRRRGFLNDSTLQSLYGARLTRAYLGASNPNRVGGRHDPVTSVIVGDDLAMKWGQGSEKFAKPVAQGQPLHLVNVTINETLEGKSGLQTNRRRGIGMAVGPAGISAGVRHHVVFMDPDSPAEGSSAVGSRCAPEAKKKRGSDQLAVVVYPRDDDEFRMFDYRAGSGEHQCFGGEPLSLGQWTGISGAAFSTGVGSETAFGQSFLAGFLNARLGYWWDSGVEPWKRNPRGRPGSRAGRAFARALPVYSHLIDELFGRFLGTGRRLWNLSDGGHFENLGAYELIRRRVPVIVVIDAEADPDGRLGGLANLVRKARADFDAEIRFLNRTDLDNLNGAVELAKYIGNLRAVQTAVRVDPEGGIGATPAGEPGPDRAHAALAIVRYERCNQNCSLLVYVKPTLVGGEPLDVVHYRGDHAAFPQQPTADQFFNDAQWEAYRALGERIAERVFDDDSNPFCSFLAFRELVCGRANSASGDDAAPQPASPPSPARTAT